MPFQLIVAIFPQATQRTFAVPFGYSVGAISWNGTSRTSLNPQRGRSKGDTHGTEIVYRRSFVLDIDGPAS